MSELKQKYKIKVVPLHKSDPKIDQIDQKQFLNTVPTKKKLAHKGPKKSKGPQNEVKVKNQY